MVSLLPALEAQRCHSRSQGVTLRDWPAQSGAAAGCCEAGPLSASSVSGHGHKDLRM